MLMTLNYLTSEVSSNSQVLLFYLSKSVCVFVCMHIYNSAIHFAKDINDLKLITQYSK